MVAYAKPQQWKKDESERLRGEGDQILINSASFMYAILSKGYNQQECAVV